MSERDYEPWTEVSEQAIVVIDGDTLCKTGGGAASMTIVERHNAEMRRMQEVIDRLRKPSLLRRILSRFFRRGVYITNNPNPAPRCNAPVVRIDPSIPIAEKCKECGVYFAFDKSGVCEGCLAYRDHQA